MAWSFFMQALYEWIFIPAVKVKTEQYGCWKTYRTFEPLYRVCGPYIQTIYDRFCFWKHSRESVNYVRTFIDTQRGTKIALDWSHPTAGQQRSRYGIVLICPGIGGRSSDASVLELVNSFPDYTVCVYNRSNELVPPSMANVKDLHDVIHHISRVPSDTHVHVIGISAAGNLVLKYAGTYQNDRVATVVALSTGVDLVALRSKLTFDSLIDQVLYHKNGHWFHTHSLIALENALINTHNRYEYYLSHSSCTTLRSISVPTLYLASRDDPYLDDHQLECVIEATKENPFVSAVITSHGGHVSWVGKTNWLSDVIRDFIEFREGC